MAAAKKPTINSSLTYGIVALPAFFLTLQILPTSAKAIDAAATVDAIWMVVFAVATLTTLSILIRLFVEIERIIVDPADAILGVEAALGLVIWFLVLEWIKFPTNEHSEPLTVGLTALLASCEGARRMAENVKKPTNEID